VYTSIEGCANLKVQADRHVVQQGPHPGSDKYPIPDMEVRVFDKTELQNDGISASWHNYEGIWTNYTDVSRGFTDINGSVDFIIPEGNFIVIGNYTSEVAENLFMGVSAGNLACGDSNKKYLQVIEKADGDKVSGKYHKKTGSELLIIEPEYIEWDSTQELYPFIFDSLGEWNVTTVVFPPEGFVADYNNLTEEVYSEYEAIQFTITDVGSEWVDTLVEHEVKHKGKKEKIKSKIGVKKKKGWNKDVDKEKDKVESETFATPPDPSTTITLTTTTTSTTSTLSQSPPPSLIMEQDEGSWNITQVKKAIKNLYNLIFGK
jgi:hypothetical protein